MLKYLILILFFLINYAADGQAAPAPMSLSLKQCITLALQNNVNLLVSQARQEQASGQQAQLDADFLPQIDAVASQQRTWWENIAALGFSGFGSTIGPFNTFNAYIMVSERILDFSALAHAQAGKIKWQASQWEEELAKQQVILATGLAYVQELGYEDELKASYEDVRLAQHFLDLSLHQFNAGLASAVDVARDRTQLAQQQARQEQLRLNVIKSQLELKRLIKMPLAQPIELTDPLIRRSYNYLNIDQALAQAQQYRMEMKVADAQSDYTKTELKASQREYWPTVDVTGQYGRMGSDPDNTTHAAQAMVSFSLPIWDGGRIQGDVKEKRGLNQEQQFERDDLNWKIEEDVRLAMETLTSSYAQLEAEKKVEDFARQELNLAQDRFTAGLGDNIQVINAQVELSDAQDKYSQALAQYNQAQLNYFGAVGAPEQFDLSMKEGNG